MCTRVSLKDLNFLNVWLKGLTFLLLGWVSCLTPSKFQNTSNMKGWGKGQAREWVSHYVNFVKHSKLAF